MAEPTLGHLRVLLELQFGSWELGDVSVAE